MSSAPIAHSTPDPVQHAMQMSLGFMVTAACRAALESNIADQLASGAKPVSELARAGNADEDALYRTLRALATVGIFTETAPRIFANTPASEVFKADHPSRVRDALVFMTNRMHFRAYGEFMHSVRTGKPAVEKAFGMPVFDYFPTDPESNREFNNAMTSMSAMVVPAVLETYDFSGLGTLCDIAGGHGFVLTSILEKHTDLKGILFDLEHVLVGGRERIQQMGLSSRCEAVSGDFFKSVPAADSYVMKHIIHDWEESKALTILRNIHNAMRGKGKLILIESVISGMNQPDLGKWIDLEMLAMPGGKERTEEQYRELLGKAGFKLTRVVSNKSPLSVVEAVKL